MVAFLWHKRHRVLPSSFSCTALSILSSQASELSMQLTLVSKSSRMCAIWSTLKQLRTSITQWLRSWITSKSTKIPIIRLTNTFQYHWLGLLKSLMPSLSGQETPQRMKKATVRQKRLSNISWMNASRLLATQESQWQLNKTQDLHTTWCPP